MCKKTFKPLNNENLPVNFDLLYRKVRPLEEFQSAKQVFQNEQYHRYMDRSRQQINFLSNKNQKKTLPNIFNLKTSRLNNRINEITSTITLPP